MKCDLRACRCSPTRSQAGLKGPGTYGDAAIVMEAGTGAILYAKNIDAHFYPASITKVLTALVALENGKFEDPVVVSEDCVGVPGAGGFLGGAEGRGLRSPWSRRFTPPSWRRPTRRPTRWGRTWGRMRARTTPGFLGR